MSDTAVIARDYITGAIVPLKVIDNGDTTFSGVIARSAKAVAPVNQDTTNPYVDVAGSLLDTLNNLTASYTILNTAAVNAITWQVLGANASDFSDAVVVKAGASVLALAVDSYSANPAVWRYYKVQIKSTVAATPGTAQVRGVSKG